MGTNNGRYPPVAPSSDADEDVNMFSFMGSAIPDHSHFNMHLSQQQQQQHQPQQQQQRQQQHYHQPSTDAYMMSYDATATTTTSTGKGSKRKTGGGGSHETTNGAASAATATSSSPASVDLRKEQNRAAQRAFRDRKERYLQQLENMIQDLKDQHFVVTSSFQKKVLELSEKNEVLKSENHYLREVVFAFEAALSKGAPAVSPSSQSGAESGSGSGAVMELGEERKSAGCGCGHGAAVLQNVKEELYRRHHAIKAAAQKEPSPKIADGSTGPSTPPDVIMSDAAKPTPQVKREMEGSKESEPKTKVRRKDSTSGVSCGNNSSGSEEKRNRGQELQTASASNMADGTRTNEILYKAPPLFIAPAQEAGGQPSLISSPFDPLTIPRPAYLEPGTLLPKFTEYLKHPTVFDELQSSLFPPGTLQSLVDSNMATPQEVIEDKSLFDPLQQGASQKQQQQKKEELQSAFNRNSDSKDSNNTGNDRNGSTQDNRGSKGVAIRKNHFLPADHRLRAEFEEILTAPPATDPNIDPMIYMIPHDPRIDIVPCPQLRAQMILHQDKYDVNELFDIILSKAICHGPALDRHSWELPDVIYIKYGYLFGTNSERHRRKIWPRKIEASSPSSSSSGSA